LKKW